MRLFGAMSVFIFLFSLVLAAGCGDSSSGSDICNDLVDKFESCGGDYDDLAGFGITSRSEALSECNAGATTADADELDFARDCADTSSCPAFAICLTTILSS